MLAAILSSDLAVHTSILVVRAFVHLRKILSSNENMSKKINALERKYDDKFNVVFNALRQLIEKPAPQRRPIGFNRKQE